MVQNDNVKLLPVNHSSTIDKLLDYVPDLFDKVNKMLMKKLDVNENKENNNEEKEGKLKNKGKENKKNHVTYEFTYKNKDSENNINNQETFEDD